MEKPPTVKNQKLSQKSNKRKPVKVVYISNPMKIKATPSEFRAVVQQLTGRYATFPPSDGLIAGVVKDNNRQEDDKLEENQLEKWRHYSNSTSVMSARTARLDLFYESGCREDQVMEQDNLVVYPQIVEGFPSLLLPSDHFG